MADISKTEIDNTNVEKLGKKMDHTFKLRLCKTCKIACFMSKNVSKFENLPSYCSLLSTRNLSIMIIRYCMDTAEYWLYVIWRKTTL